MTAVDHAELKRLAEGATPGEWTCKEGSTAYPECDDKDFWAVVLSPAGKEVVTLYERSSLDDRADYDFDAAFIAAANPAVFLALLSEIEGLKAERDDYRVEAATLTGKNAALLSINAALNEEVTRHLRTQAPDSWRPDREAVRKAIDWLADEIGAAERGKATTRRVRKLYAKDQAVNRITAALRPQTAESGK